MKPATPLPPWHTPELWHEANRAVVSRIFHRRSVLQPAAVAAGRILILLDTLEPDMERLCAATCRFCPEPCCQTARVWFDLRDLLLLHFTGRAIPPGQPITVSTETCRYLGPSGCRLPRASRPFVCTWYLCPLQKRIARRSNAAQRLQLETDLTTIQSIRKQLENRFIALTAT